MESAILPLPVPSVKADESEEGKSPPSPLNSSHEESLGDAIANAFKKRQKRQEMQEASGNIMEEKRSEEPKPALDFQSQLRAKLNTIGSNRDLQPKPSPKLDQRPAEQVLLLPSKQENDDRKEETAPLSDNQEAIPSSSKEEGKSLTSLADETALAITKHSMAKTDNVQTEPLHTPTAPLTIPTAQGNKLFIVHT